MFYWPVDIVVMQKNVKNLASYADRRHEPRIQIIEQVVDAESGFAIGFTLNINAYGMLLISETAYQQGEQINMNLNMPMGRGEIVPLSMLGECRWTAPLAGSNMHKNGFLFCYTNRAKIEYTKILFDALTAG